MRFYLILNKTLKFSYALKRLTKLWDIYLQISNISKQTFQAFYITVQHILLFFNLIPSSWCCNSCRYIYIRDEKMWEIYLHWIRKSQICKYFMHFTVYFPHTYTWNTRNKCTLDSLKRFWNRETHPKRNNNFKKFGFIKWKTRHIYEKLKKGIFSIF